MVGIASFRQIAVILWEQSTLMAGIASFRQIAVILWEQSTLMAGIAPFRQIAVDPVGTEHANAGHCLLRADCCGSCGNRARQCRALPPSGRLLWILWEQSTPMPGIASFGQIAVGPVGTEHANGGHCPLQADCCDPVGTEHANGGHCPLQADCCDPVGTEHSNGGHCPLQADCCDPVGTEHSNGGHCPLQADCCGSCGNRAL